jgi:hypothetical protein
MNQVIQLPEQIMECQGLLRYTTPQHGDVRHTWADTCAVQTDLRLGPHTSPEEGLQAQVPWQIALPTEAD